MSTSTTLSAVYPLGSRLNEQGRLEVGGCDVIELAREFGTPAFVVAEDDLRARARAFLAAGRARHDDFEVVFASKAFPTTAVLELFAEEGLWCDVASGGELHLALAAGFPAERLVLHGNAKSRAELAMALRQRVGLIVIDNLSDVDRLRELVADGERGAAGPQPVLIRVAPDVSGDTHTKISTGQARTKFGFSLVDAAAAIEAVRAVDGLELAGLHAHIGSQLLELPPFARSAAALAGLGGPFGTYDLGGGLGVAYKADQQPPSIEDYVAANVQALHDHVGPQARLLIEPGRSLVANGCVTLYTVESIKRNVDLWVAVDGGMSDNLRPMLYDARYEAEIADRFGGDTECVLAGKHCESSDVIVRDARLADPRVGDIVVTPATGGYGYAMANNYNGVPRPPIVFCRDGDARLVVRRETYADLEARDVR
jgi:diaminopimelate decarboxylase